MAEGQLGNQLFQYAFLKTIINKNEKLVVAGFHNLKTVFEVDDILHINKNNKYVLLFLQRLIKPTLDLLSNKRLINQVSVDYETVLKLHQRESTTFSFKKGFFSKITYVKLGFFQSEYFFKESIAKKLTIKKEYSSAANGILRSLPNNAYKVFIHIRRGDYKNHKVYGRSALLPLTYYKNQIDWFLTHKKNCYFIFLSDDAAFINTEFGDIENKLISIENHYGTDFALMTQCKSAILSPSSFSWWGSYLMKDKDTIFAPKYWLGFNSKTEYHKHGTPSYAEEVEL